MTTQRGNDAAAKSEERILLVDDNPTNLKVLYQTLNGLGHKLLVAKDGESALETAAKMQPHLVLLDIMMPGIDGYEVCRRLKADPATRDAAVIFLSALDETADKVRGLELGAVDYVSKPFQGEEVIARVNTHLTLLRLRRELAAANARMRRDLEAAARVQHSLLPATLPAQPGARFAWRYRPCDELAGDSLNIFSLDETTVGAYVLDVTGHGVASALLSVAAARVMLPRADAGAVVTTSGDDGAVRPTGPAQVMRLLNERFPMDVGGDYFFTIVYAVLDTTSGHLTYASAGHPGPVHIGADGSPAVFAATGVPIGLVDDAVHKQITVRLAPGDRVYLYTDGLYEVWNAEREMLDQDRLHAQLARGRSLGLEESLDAAIAHADAWSDGQEQTDDIAAIGVEFTAPADAG